jgi:hypothetical protein
MHYTLSEIFFNSVQAGSGDVPAPYNIGYTEFFPRSKTAEA